MPEQSWKTPSATSVATRSSLRWDAMFQGILMIYRWTHPFGVSSAILISSSLIAPAPGLPDSQVTAERVLVISPRVQCYLLPRNTPNRIDSLIGMLWEIHTVYFDGLCNTSPTEDLNEAHDATLTDGRR